MFAPVARQFNIITHEQAPTRAARAQTSCNFRISGRQPVAPPVLARIGRQGQFESTSETTLRPITKSKNKSNLESCLLYSDPKELSKLFDRQIESKTFWNERKVADDAKQTLFNCSSVNYDFVTNTKHKNTEDVSHIRAKTRAAYRKKAIAEFVDLSSVYGPKYNEDYRSLLKRDPQCFHNTKGPFSHFLDNSHKSGQLSKPFTKFKCL